MSLLTIETEKLINKKLLNKQVYDVLLRLIIENKLKPGAKLSAVKLSQELNVGRSPVSAALSSLERDGYVEILPQSGTFVKDFSREELDMIYRARMALDALVVKEAVLKADHKKLLEFRARFCAFSGDKTPGKQELLAMFYLDVELHDYFAAFIPEVVRKGFLNICNLTKRSRLLNLDFVAEQSTTDALIEGDATIHVQIIDAMLAGDVCGAIELSHKDTEQTRENVLRFLY